ncbi:MAG: hypothetical protein NVSMB32_08600 [Actinomycetota bacterium]
MTDATNGLFRRLRRATSRASLAPAPISPSISHPSGDRQPVLPRSPWLRVAFGLVANELPVRVAAFNRPGQPALTGGGLWAREIVEPVWVLEWENDRPE